MELFSLPTSNNYTQKKQPQQNTHKKHSKKTLKLRNNFGLNDIDNVQNDPIPLEQVPKMSQITQNGNKPYYHNVGQTEAGVPYVFKRYISYYGNNLPGAVRKHNRGAKKVEVPRTSDDDEYSSDSDDDSGKTSIDSYSDIHSLYSDGEIYDNNDDSDSDSILNELKQDDDDDELMTKYMNESDNDEPDDESTPIKDEDLKKIYGRHSAWGGKQTRRRSVSGKRGTRSRVTKSRRVTRSRSKKRPTKNTGRLSRRRGCRQRK
jgi:hypothetical protein